eukprot:6557458-Prymnesium_polylepis.1
MPLPGRAPPPSTGRVRHCRCARPCRNPVVVRRPHHCRQHLRHRRRCRRRRPPQRAKPAAAYALRRYRPPC